MQQNNQIEKEGYITLEPTQPVIADIAGVLETWKEFCKLPDQVKQLFTFENGVGYESVAPGRIDTKETLQITIPYGKNQLAHVYALDEPQFSFFRKALNLIATLTDSVEIIAVRMGASQRLIETILNDKHRWKLRFLHYPSRPYQEGSLIAAPHTDKAGVTVHLSEDMPGLEIFWNNQWNPVATRHDTIVAYPGMAMQYHTAGIAKGICHQVRVQPEIEKRGRYSVVLFVDFGNIYYDKEVWGSTQKVFPRGENYTMPFDQFKTYFVEK